MTLINRSIRYESGSDFFNFSGDAIMKLSLQAALDVCKLATEKNELIGIIEGGYWRDNKFHASLSAIWELKETNEDCKAINSKAANFIQTIFTNENIDTFIITLD